MAAFSNSLFTMAPAGDSNDTKPEEGKTSHGGEDSHLEPKMEVDESDAEQTVSSSQGKAVKMENENGSAGGIPKDESENASIPKPAPKKKKGTAATIKAPKRPKGSGPGASKKLKIPGSGKKTTTTSSVAGSDAGTVPDLEADHDGAEDGDASESDNGPYCICRGPDNHKFMIACDKCEDWFHGDCIGMDKYTGENLVQKYICPSCSDASMGYVTRYKKSCALEDCERPARIYGAALEDEGARSYFCSDEHNQTWWEQLILTLPKERKGGGGADDALMQEQFMALLSASEQDGEWHIGDKPFGVPPNFWETVDPKDVLTEEESTILSTSAAERYSLGEEIVLCKKMLQLLDMAMARREAAIAAGKGSAKDLCGYDFRLDDVGATAQFSRFIASAAGEAIFKAGKLEAPVGAPYSAEEAAQPATDGTVKGMPPGFGCTEDGFDPVAAGMCTRKKCKPHHGWNGMLTKHVKHNMKELAREAKENLDAEERIREASAGRFVRKKYENNSVQVIYSDDEGDTEMVDAD